MDCTSESNALRSALFAGIGYVSLRNIANESYLFPKRTFIDINEGALATILDYAEEKIEELCMECRNYKQQSDQKSIELKKQNELVLKLTRQLKWSREDIENLLTIAAANDLKKTKDMAKAENEIRQKKLKEHELLATISQLQVELNGAEDNAMKIMEEVNNLCLYYQRQLNEMEKFNKELREENVNCNESNAQLRKALREAKASLKLSRREEESYKEKEIEATSAPEACPTKYIEDTYKEYQHVSEILKETQDQLSDALKKNHELNAKLSLRCGCLKSGSAFSSTAIAALQGLPLQCTNNIKCCLRAARYRNDKECGRCLSDEMCEVYGDIHLLSCPLDEPMSVVSSDVEAFPLPVGVPGVPGSKHLSDALKYLRCRGKVKSNTLSKRSSLDLRPNALGTEYKNYYQQNFLNATCSLQTPDLEEPFEKTNLLQHWFNLAKPALSNIIELDLNPGIYLKICESSQKICSQKSKTQPMPCALSKSSGVVASHTLPSAVFDNSYLEKLGSDYNPS